MLPGAQTNRKITMKFGTVGYTDVKIAYFLDSLRSFPQDPGSFPGRIGIRIRIVFEFEPMHALCT